MSQNVENGVRTTNGSTAEQYRDGTNTELKDQEGLFSFLANHDVPCPACRYNLRSVRIAACPECGHQITLSVGSTTSMSTAWIALVSALLLPAGLGAIVIAALVMAGGDIGQAMTYADGPVVLGLLCLGLYSVLCIPLSIAAICGRGVFLRGSVITRRCIAALAIGATIWTFGIILTTIIDGG